MGGKAKQSQRTKNNVRPSSSGRSVAAGGALPALLAAAGRDSTLPPEFALCFKKLNKKDPITKTKALQELLELAKTSEPEAAVAALGGWAFHYRALTAESDRRVREATQTAHAALIQSAGRGAAASLRALVPAWLAARHDTHGPARAAAQLALERTFPDNKLPQLMAFCKEEILTYLLENISAARAAPTDDEEAADRRARLAAATLRALDYFITHLPPEHAPWLRERLTPALPNFWAIQSHPDGQLRTAWYIALGALGSLSGCPGDEAIARRAAKALGGPGGGGGRWGALLRLGTTHPGGIGWLDVKRLTNDMLEVLANGGWGDARALADTLPPLFALLPDGITTPEFCESFFEAYIKGLTSKGVATSKMERQAWLAGLGACLDNVAGRAEGVAAALLAHRCWVGAALGGGPAAARASGRSLGALVARWLQRPPPLSDMLVRGFWMNLTAALQAELDRTKDDFSAQASVAESHIVLLRTMRATTDVPPRGGISFADEPTTPPMPPPVPPPSLPPPLAARYTHSLDAAAEAAAGLCLQIAIDAQSTPLLEPLVSLLSDWGPNSGGLAALAAAGVGGPRVLAGRLLHWLKKGPSLPLAQLLFLIMALLPEEQRDEVFADMNQLPPSSVAVVLRLAVSHPARAWGAARRWVRAGAGGALARAAAADPALLAMALVEDDDGCVMGAETLERVAAAARDALSKVAAGDPEGAASSGEGAARLAARVLTAAAGPAPPPAVLHLLEATFVVLLQEQPGNINAMSGETFGEAAGAVGDALQALAPPARAAALTALTDRVWAHLQPNLHQVNIDQLEHAATLWNAVTRWGGASEAAGALEPRGGATEARAAALVHDIVQGRLSCPYEEWTEMHQSVPSPRVLGSWLAGVVLRGAAVRAGGGRAVGGALPQLLHDYRIVCSLADGYGFWEHYDLIQRAHNKMTVLVEAISEEMGPEERAATRGALEERAGALGHYWAIALVHFSDKPRRPALTETTESELTRAEPTAPEPVNPDRRPADVSLTGDGLVHVMQAEAQMSEDLDVKERASWAAAARAMLAAAGGGGGGGTLAALTRARVADPDPLLDAHYDNPKLLTLDGEVDISSPGAWAQVAAAAAAAHWLAALVRARGWDADQRVWDFANLTMCSLGAALRAAAAGWRRPAAAALAAAAGSLARALQDFMAALPARCLREQPAPHVADLPKEFADVFAPDWHANLYRLLLHVLETGASDETCYGSASMAAALQATLGALRWRWLPAGGPGGTLTAARLAAAAAGLLAAPGPPALQRLAHQTLMHLTEPLVLDDAAALTAWSEAAAATEGAADEAGVPPPALALHVYRSPLRAALDRLGAALTAAEVAVGENCCEVAPFTEDYDVALGALYLADALHAMHPLQRDDLLQHYLEVYRGEGFTEPLLSCALRLLPADALHAGAGAGGGPAVARLAPYFAAPPAPGALAAARAAHVSALACRTVGGAVGTWDPAGARAWRGTAPGRAARALTALVRAHVSPTLVRAQLADARARASALPEGAEVAVHWAAGEAVVRLPLEERCAELTVSLSREHPLGAPGLSAGGAEVAGAPAWLALQLARGGALGAALALWAGAVGARAGAAPQCYICYCRLHPSTGRLPREVCHQCHNKFHIQCLRKWFSSSKKSNCPLCRAKI